MCQTRSKDLGEEYSRQRNSQCKVRNELWVFDEQKENGCLRPGGEQERVGNGFRWAHVGQIKRWEC